MQNQLEHFHQEDIARGENMHLYFVDRFCDGLLEGTQTVDGNNFIIDEFFVCPLNSQRHTSIVRLEIKADSLRFVSNR